MLGRIALHPVLFAAYAVVFLYSVNLDEVLPVDAVAPLWQNVLGAAVVTAILALVFRDARRGAIVATALVIAFFAYGHVSPLLAERGLDDVGQMILWAALVWAAVIFAIRAKEAIPRVTAGLNVAAALLIVVAGTAIVPHEIERAGHGPTPAAALAANVSASGRATRRPDIYFLVFDRYGSAEALQRRFGLENDMYDWLRSHGFQVPAHSHANYRATDFSLTATLNMRYLDELTEQIGRVSGDRTPAQALLRNHEVGRFLKSQGYTYYQLATWFGPTRSIDIADETLVLGVTSEFENVLRDTTIVPALERLTGVKTTEPTFLDRHRDGTLFELRQLRRVSTAPGPKFVFAHILLPHDPYVFKADGSLLTEAEAKAGDERDLYRDHLAFANAQIQEMVGYLLSGPEEQRPVVIIEGDEGPLACRSVDCVGTDSNYLRIRLGNLIAMYLPGVDVELSDTFSSVNTFRVVLREYFGADLPNLPDRSYTWPDNDHIYDFRDVTEQIGGPSD